MTRDEANLILDMVKHGAYVPDDIINLALVMTGDLQTNGNHHGITQ